MANFAYNQKQLSEYLQWDVMTWQKALLHWDCVLAKKDLSCLKALELGARDGGLSLYLAQKGVSVVCSDLFGPTKQAHELHKKHGLSHLVEYGAIDATTIPADNASFDIVVFKSILGGIGMAAGMKSIKAALQEIYRVLKPGGILLFCENLKGSIFHQFARRSFVSWGKTWYYPSIVEMEGLLRVFAEFQIGTYGFLSCVKKDFAPLVDADKLICRSSRSKNHYMAFGHATKACD